MINLLKYVAYSSLFFLCVGCGVIKGSSNPIIDAGIKIADKAIPEDSYLEESLEDVIEGFTGIEIDLSPASPEKD